MSVCKATLLNGYPCLYPAKLDGYCMVHHKKYVKTTCAICLDIIERDKFTLHCKHSYHSECIKQWLQKNNTCPYCRSAVSTQTLHRMGIHFFQRPPPRPVTVTRAIVMEYMYNPPRPLSNTVTRELVREAARLPLFVVVEQQSTRSPSMMERVTSAMQQFLRIFS